MADAKKDKLQIRNSTVDFLVFTKDAHEVALRYGYRITTFG